MVSSQFGISVRQTMVFSQFGIGHIYEACLAFREYRRYIPPWCTSSLRLSEAIRSPASTITPYSRFLQLHTHQGDAQSLPSPSVLPLVSFRPLVYTSQCHALASVLSMQLQVSHNVWPSLAVSRYKSFAVLASHNVCPALAVSLVQECCSPAAHGVA